MADLAAAFERTKDAWKGTFGKPMLKQPHETTPWNQSRWRKKKEKKDSAGGAGCGSCGWGDHHFHHGLGHRQVEDAIIQAVYSSDDEPATWADGEIQIDNFANVSWAEGDGGGGWVRDSSGDDGSSNGGGWFGSSDSGSDSSSCGSGCGGD